MLWVFPLAQRNLLECLCTLKLPCPSGTFHFALVFVVTKMLSEADCSFGAAAGARCAEALEEWI